MRASGPATRARSAFSPSSTRVTSGPSARPSAASIAASCPADPAFGLNRTHTFMEGSERDARPSPERERRASRHAPLTRPPRTDTLAPRAAPDIMVGMPEFSHPEFLWLAPAAVLVAWWWARRRRPALRFADVRLFAGLPAGRARRARWGGAILRGLAALALVVACAGPRKPDLRT